MEHTGDAGGGEEMNPDAHDANTSDDQQATFAAPITTMVARSGRVAISERNGSLVPSVTDPAAATNHKTEDDSLVCG